MLRHRSFQSTLPPSTLCRLIKGGLRTGQPKGGLARMGAGAPMVAWRLASNLAGGMAIKLTAPCGIGLAASGVCFHFRVV